MLKIEGDKISAHETAVHLDDLMKNIASRREEKFLSDDMEAEMQRLTEDKIDLTSVDGVVSLFHGTYFQARTKCGKYSNSI